VSERPRAETCALALALRRSRGHFLAAGLASGAVNVLALTGPAYMLEVYNGVLPSRSVPLLALLTLTMLALYAASGVIDFLRLRLLLRAAHGVDRGLSARIFSLLSALPLKALPGGDGLQPLRDLDLVCAFLAGPGPTALFDLPWMPLYLGVIYLMHPFLGALATAGTLTLVALMLAAEALSAGPVAAATQSAGRRWAFAAEARRNAETIRAMGLQPQLNARWSTLAAHNREAQFCASRPVTGVGAIIKVVRPALQSGLLGLGAYLVIKGDGSPGTMVAASIILSRALAPVETAVAHWRAFIAARQAYARLAALFAANPQQVRRQTFAAPRFSLEVEALCVAPPGATAAVVRGIDVSLQAGSGLGVIGPSAAGKSTLARALVGAWHPMSGSVRLDGRALCDWDPDALGRHVGYLPQDIGLFRGTIAENIARFDEQAEARAITAAARAAGVHDMIARLPQGYGTKIGEGGMALSAGQRQRLALARALYGEPFLLVLDEPDASLDADGERNLTAAIAAVRRRGGIVVVIAHRRTALASVDQILALEGGRVRAIGPKGAVLARVARVVAPDAVAAE